MLSGGVKRRPAFGEIRVNLKSLLKLPMAIESRRYVVMEETKASHVIDV